MVVRTRSCTLLAQELLALFSSKGRKHRTHILQRQKPQWEVFIDDVLEELKVQDRDSIIRKWFDLQNEGLPDLPVSSCYLIASVIRLSSMV